MERDNENMADRERMRGRERATERERASDKPADKSTTPATKFIKLN